MRIPHILGALLAGTVIVGAGSAYGQRSATGSEQVFPNKPIRIVTSEPGGSNDFASRLIAQGLFAGLRQQVVVENRGGASGAIAGQILAKALPDGYTLLLYSSGIWILPLLQDMPYDPVRDFSPVTLVATSPSVLVVSPALPANSVKELIVLAKAKPGALNYSSGGLGTTGHLSAELFKSMAGVNMVHVPFKGGGPALNGVIGGQVQLLFATAGGAMPHVKSGKLKALAVTSARPSALLPGLPTVAASGVAGYESRVSYGVWAAARTPAAIIRRLNQEILRYLASAETKERFLSVGMELAGSTPGEFSAAIKSELVVWAKVIKDAGIHIN